MHNMVSNPIPNPEELLRTVNSMVYRASLPPEEILSTIISMVSKYTPLTAKKVPKQASPIMMPKMSLCCQNVPSGGK